MTINWQQLAGMLAVFGMITTGTLYLAGRHFYPIDKGQENKNEIEKNEIKIMRVEIGVRDDVDDVRNRQTRSWKSISDMRKDISSMNGAQISIKKDVENILLILRGTNPGRAYRSPREEK